MNFVSTNVANTISTNMPTNSDDKKVQYKIHCYILHNTLLLIILQLIIAFICYIRQSIGETKKNCHTNNIKIKNNEF